MRISTNMIYELGGSSVSKQQSSLYKLQHQVSSGKRVNTPSDDPLAASRALEISQSKSVSEQLSVNADYATSALQAQEGALGSISELLSQMRQVGVYAGNGSLTSTDQRVLATDLRSKYAELFSLANTQDNGKFLFSGFMGETQPFSEISPGVVDYNGDEGQRLIQVTPSRQVPVSASGVEVFQRIRNGNGQFSVSADPAVTGVTNSGSGLATPGSVIDASLWNAAGNAKDYRVVFARDTTTVPPVVTYDIVANVATTVNGTPYAAGDSLLRGAGVASAATPSATGGPRYPRTYTDGAAISFKYVTGDTNPDTAWDLGVQFSVSGEPTSSPTDTTPLTSSDRFDIKASVADQDIFETVHSLITALETTSGTQLANHVMTFLQDLTLAEESVMKAITTVGITMAEVESHKSNNDDLVIQYKTDISDLEDLDYAEALTDLALRQANLQASQKSFLAISGLSLFNFI